MALTKALYLLTLALCIVNFSFKHMFESITYENLCDKIKYLFQCNKISFCIFIFYDPTLSAGNIIWIIIEKNAS